MRYEETAEERKRNEKSGVCNKMLNGRLESNSIEGGSQCTESRKQN